MALARSAGIAAQGCEGCHASSNEASLLLETNPPTFVPGTDVEVVVTISGQSVQGGGIYISTEHVGELEALPGEGLAPVLNGLVHVTPKGAQSNAVEFRFGWKAPAEPGAVRFFVYALGTNANGQRSGDSPVEGSFDRVFGCEGQEYYFDGDGDGHGRSTGLPLLACAGAPPPNYSADNIDCVDYDAGVFQGATELCNKKDDDCDGEIDEDAEPIELWPDPDGDGYYDKKEGEPVIGCVGLANYAALPGDCDPNDELISPAMEETCNYRDDDCDGEADDRVRPTCGEGWCRRSSTTCLEEDCYPGAPEPERCNYLDDDCDGEVDEGDLCETGQHCLAGECVATDSLVAPDGGVPSGAGGGAGQTSSPDPMSQPKRSSAQSSGCAVAGAPRGSSAWLLGLLLAARALRSRQPSSKPSTASRKSA